MPLDIGDKSKVSQGKCPKCDSDLETEGHPEKGRNVDELVERFYCPECDTRYHIVYEYEDVREIED
jgi:uncharacterized protein with PIN domain